MTSHEKQPSGVWIYSYVNWWPSISHVGQLWVGLLVNLTFLPLLFSPLASYLQTCHFRLFLPQDGKSSTLQASSLPFLQLFWCLLSSDCLLSWHLIFICRMDNWRIPPPQLTPPAPKPKSPKKEKRLNAAFLCCRERKIVCTHPRENPDQTCVYAINFMLVLVFLPYFLANVFVEISHVNTWRNWGEDRINVAPSQLKKLGIHEDCIHASFSGCFSFIFVM